ncbi:mitochondrial ribosomal subunit protein-domain-containing protein, partial [Bombardia bombarda]
MASAANSLRLCLGSGRQISRLRHTARPCASLLLRRALSTRRRGAADADYDPRKAGPALEFDKPYASPGDFLTDYLRNDNLSEEEREQADRMLETWNKVPEDKQREYSQLTREINQEVAPARRPIFVKKDAFWNDEETDTDIITDEVGEDDFEEDDILSMAHGKLEEHREFREYARIAVWEMPLLSKLAKKFEPPAQGQALRFRYTSYMGEFHPADRKVVVEFCPKDLSQLNEAQQLKLKKLAGSRYNPEKDLVRMSCERFEHQAQNKRFLGDMVQKMINTAKDPTDMFIDIPLDTRHHTFTTKPKFPKGWRMSEERKQELEGQRRKALALDMAKEKAGGLIDGVKSIREAL